MAPYWFCTARSNLDSWRFNQGRDIVRSWPLALATGVTRRAGDEGLIPSEMAVRVIGSWYYTSELPAEEAATLRAAMVSKDCESLETWLKTSVHDADRNRPLYSARNNCGYLSCFA